MVRADGVPALAIHYYIYRKRGTDDSTSFLSEVLGKPV